MSLTIKESNGTFLVKGIINSTTLKQFKDYLEFLITYNKSVTINIDSVTAINKNGLKVIEDTFETAKINNKAFNVIGYGCAAIYDSVNILDIEVITTEAA